MKGSLQNFCRFFKKDLQRRMKQNEKKKNLSTVTRKDIVQKLRPFLIETPQYIDVLKTAQSTGDTTIVNGCLW